MKVAWKYRDLTGGLGHGIVFELEVFHNRATFGFIEGYEWMDENHPKMTVYLDQKLKELPASITTELRLAILLFLTDKKKQEPDGIIHGFRTHFNA
jgi:hypothetical protein